MRARDSRLAPAKSLDATPLFQGEEEKDLKDPPPPPPPISALDLAFSDAASPAFLDDITAPCGVRLGATAPPQPNKASSLIGSEFGWEEDEREEEEDEDEDSRFS